MPAKAAGNDMWTLFSTRSDWSVISIFAGMALSLFLLSPSIANATCCKCTNNEDPTNTLCINTESVDCDVFAPASSNEDVKKLNCVKEKLSEQQCQQKLTGGPSALCTQPPQDEKDYKPKEKSAKQKDESRPIAVPNLNVKIPGLKFGSIVEKNGRLYVPYFAQYMAAIYNWLIGISLVATAIAFVIGGFLYIVASSGATKNNGKEIMRDAAIGLILVLGAKTLLGTINPQTVSPESLALISIHTEQWFGDEEGPTTGNVKAGKRICDPSPTSGGSCIKLCDGCKAKAELPKQEGAADPASLVLIPKNIPGLQVGEKGGHRMTKEAVDALVRAAAVAQGFEGGPYTLGVVSSFRDLRGQVEIACGKYCLNAASDVGVTVAVPGGSLHGSGVAVDLVLREDRTKAILVDCCKFKTQKSQNELMVAKLQKIMAEAGWVRYCAEVWHFEYGVAEGGSRKKDCPWASVGVR